MIQFNYLIQFSRKKVLITIIHPFYWRMNTVKSIVIVSITSTTSVNCCHRQGTRVVSVLLITIDVSVL